MNYELPNFGQRSLKKKTKDCRRDNPSLIIQKHYEFLILPNSLLLQGMSAPGGAQTPSEQRLHLRRQ